MGFFDFLRGPAVDPVAIEAAEKRRELSEASLKRGGLPISAIERLQHQRETQQLPSHLWTSDLSVSELSLVDDIGFDPLGQIMGASIYHVGIQWRGQSWRMNGASYELDMLSNAYANARRLAVGRLEAEARLLGAHGVVGVRLQTKSSDWSGDSVEFQAIGTAIRERRRREPTEKESPFLCALSGQDFWKLKRSGLTPVGLVAGNCTYYCIPGWNTQRVATGGFFSGSWQNQELPEFTQSLFTAREIALSRLETEARHVGAQGTVGMTIEYDAEAHHVESNNQSTLNMLYHFLAMGTAVREERSTPEVKTSRVLSLQFMPVRKPAATYTGEA